MLLVDLDPQACLTFSLGVDPDTVESSVHDVLVDGADMADVVLTWNISDYAFAATFAARPADRRLQATPSRLFRRSRRPCTWRVAIDPGRG